jgi:hypothetical protein
MAVCGARSPEFISEPGGRIVGGWRRRHVTDFERVVDFRRDFWVFARAKTTVTDLVWLAGGKRVFQSGNLSVDMLMSRRLARDGNRRLVDGWLVDLFREREQKNGTCP